MRRASKILKPDVPPQRISENADRRRQRVLIAGIGLCGIASFVAVVFLVG